MPEGNAGQGGAPGAGGAGGSGGAGGVGGQGNQGAGGAPGAGNGGQGGQGNQGNGGTPTWEQVLAGLTEEQRSLYETHTQGLRGALQSERQQRQDLARDLRQATQQLQEGSDARQRLEELTGQLDAANRRAEFLADAVRPEIGCTNPALAWLAAQELDAFDRRGNANWDTLKKRYPELFGAGQRSAPGNAGSGTLSPPATSDMNSIIRGAAGR